MGHLFRTDGMAKLRMRLGWLESSHLSVEVTLGGLGLRVLLQLHPQLRHHC